MVYKVVLLLALLGVASSELIDKRTCDPEKRRETPTHCSNYGNIVDLDERQDASEKKRLMMQKSIDAMQAKLEDQLKALTELEAKMKNIQGAPQIAFSASLVQSGQIYQGPSAEKTLVFKRIFSNIGNGYDENTGIFTAPVSGLYFFSFNTFGYNSHITGAILMKNGIRQVSAYEYPTCDGSDSSSNAIALQLAVGDKVHMELWNNGRVFDNMNGHTTFSGFLVFPV